MRHPDANALALHAGGDLTGLTRWRVQRHLKSCDVCRDEVAELQSVRDMLPALTELPGVDWDRMASEMTANIRLGIEAGECVRAPEPAPARFTLGYRPLIGVAALAVLAIAAVVIERPRLFHSLGPDAPENVALQTSPDGIGNQDLKLMVHGSDDVRMSASAQGSVGARYTDPDTGVMTVIQVDAQ